MATSPIEGITALDYERVRKHVLSRMLLAQNLEKGLFERDNLAREASTRLQLAMGWLSVLLVATAALWLLTEGWRYVGEGICG